MVRAMEFDSSVTTLERFSPKMSHEKTVKCHKTFENVIEMYFDISNHIKFGYFDHFVYRMFAPVLTLYRGWSIL